MSRRQRRRARVLALQALYQLDSGRTWEHVSAFLAQVGGPTGEGARTLAQAAWDERESLDRILGEHLEEWTVPRLGAVERALLRLGLYELLHQPDVPTAVVIDEAVELAKRFASEPSGGLINAVLDKVKVLRDESQEPG